MTKAYMSEHNAIRGFRRSYPHLAHLSNEMIRMDMISMNGDEYRIDIEGIAAYEADRMGDLRAQTILGVPATRRSIKPKGATARVRAFFAHQIAEGVSRKDAIAAAVEAGFAYCTARTQYQVALKGA